jgi:hypothetical protein
MDQERRAAAMDRFRLKREKLPLGISGNCKDERYRGKREIRRKDEERRNIFQN